MNKLVSVPSALLGKVGGRFVKVSAVAAAAVGAAATSQAAVDLTTTAGTITTDLTSAQALALPIFATMFGITLVLGFFKRATS